MTILGIDSSAKSASVAVLQDGLIKGEFCVNNGFTHSQTLSPMIEQLLAVVGVAANEIDLIAVNSGPGSFTGIRIGVSAAKGMGFANDTTCMGVSTLLSLAYNFFKQEEVKDKLICSVMDARCNQVYNALFVQKEGKLVRLCEDRAITIEELKNELKSYKKSVIFVGDGASLCYNNVLDELTGVSIASENIRFAKGSSVARAAQDGEKAQWVSSFDLLPTYLRPSQAERERQNKNNEV